MTEPPEWALRDAREIFQSDKPSGFVWNARLAKVIALALAARRRGIEEAADVADANGDPVLRDAILDLVDKEPT